jgi:hypothetical protein
MPTRMALRPAPARAPAAALVYAPRAVALLLAAGFLAAPRGAWAQNFLGARALGLGEAQRALVNSNDALYLNPAGLALGKLYSIEGAVMASLDGNDRRYNGSVTDSQAGPVAGGLGYTFFDEHFDHDNGVDHTRRIHRLDIGVATRIADKAAIGLTGRYFDFEEKLGPDPVSAGSFNAFTLDAAFQWRTDLGLALGLAGYNLTNSDHPEMPLTVGGGLGFGTDFLSIEADALYNPRIGKERVSGAASVVLANVFALRAGGSYDLANQTACFNAGVGYAADQFGADVGYRMRIKGPGGPGTNGEAEPEKTLGVSIRATFTSL